MHMITHLIDVAITPLALTTNEKMATTVVVLFMMLAFGLSNIRRWRNNQDRTDRLKETQETTIDKVEPGLTVVSGVARSAGETPERETEDGEYLAMRRRTVKREVTEQRNRERGEMNDKETNTTRTTSNKSVPFLVEDDTGSILISGESTPTLSLRQTDEVTTEPSGDNVRTRDHRKYTSSIRRTYQELLPGDEVTVYGEAVTRAAHEADEDVDIETKFVLKEDDETGDFTVTHHGKEHLIKTSSSNYRLLIGSLVMVVGGGVLGYVWLIA